MNYLITIICILSFFVILLLLIAVSQIKLAGMEVRDFWTFLKANETLNKLYAFSLKYENLSPGQQLEFLEYQNIKILRWEAKKSVNKVVPKA